ncbi:hypothetical protein MG293_002092 [Ovis ammon polii]|uniref:Uncharacterized protein n=1 Tax=Ovis ammon polii TaxID=230172 RepID=A0AAD4YJ88_OVIAM|nr:hypothetical protein MG293_002092 [Ovis ammon polii]
MDCSLPGSSTHGILSNGEAKTDFKSPRSVSSLQIKTLRPPDNQRVLKLCRLHPRVTVFWAGAPATFEVTTSLCDPVPLATVEEASQDEQEKPECVPGVQKKVMRLPGVARSRSPRSFTLLQSVSVVAPFTQMRSASETQKSFIGSDTDQ